MLEYLLFAGKLTEEWNMCDGKRATEDPLGALSQGGTSRESKRDEAVEGWMGRETEICVVIETRDVIVIIPKTFKEVFYPFGLGIRISLEKLFL